MTPAPALNRVVITGDSLSYNRYDYDPEWRTDAWDCRAGMPSWSFQTRDRILAAGRDFRYADQLELGPESEPGVGHPDGGPGAEWNAVFGGRTRTLTPRGGAVRFEVPSSTGTVTLYFQGRPDGYSRFDIWADGRPAARADTYGPPWNHRGFPLSAVSFPADPGRTRHEIELRNIEYPYYQPKITLAGSSGENRRAALTGRGGRQAAFFLYHYEERIARFRPDTLILIIGANDAYYSLPEVFRRDMTELYGRVRADFPDCRILSLPPTPAPEGHGPPPRPERDPWPERGEYAEILRRVTAAFGGEFLDVPGVFEGVPPEVWRFDESGHMTRAGNDRLRDAVCARLGV